MKLFIKYCVLAFNLEKRKLLYYIFVFLALFETIYVIWFRNENFIQFNIEYYYFFMTPIVFFLFRMVKQYVNFRYKGPLMAWKLSSIRLNLITILIIFFILLGILSEDYDEKLVYLKEIIGINWTIFGISMTILLIVYFIVLNNFGKSLTTTKNQYLHNSRVKLTFSDQWIIKINISFLIYSTFIVYFQQLNSKFTLAIVSISFILTANIIANGVNMFVNHINKEKEKLLFDEEEVKSSKKELLNIESEDFKIYKEVVEFDTESKSFKRKKKKIEKIEIKIKTCQEKLKSFTITKEDKMNNTDKYKTYKKLISKIENNILLHDILKKEINEQWKKLENKQMKIESIFKINNK